MLGILDVMIDKMGLNWPPINWPQSYGFQGYIPPQHPVGDDTTPSTTWITMGLCWSGNAQVLGKNNFPYKESVPLSTQLWHKLTPAKALSDIFDISIDCQYL